MLVVSAAEGILGDGLKCEPALSFPDRIGLTPHVGECDTQQYVASTVLGGDLQLLLQRRSSGVGVGSRAHGIAMRNELMDFHSRKLIFVRGPEGITVELSQWVEPARPAASGIAG